jgi:hypothetical protein
MGKRTFLAVIEGLETQLISTDVNTRLKGTETLSKFLISLPSDQLNNDEIVYITSYMCAKLKDHHSLIPIVLNGIYGIVSINILCTELMYVCTYICIFYILI